MSAARIAPSADVSRKRLSAQASPAEDYVFSGPAESFTNDDLPRSVNPDGSFIEVVT